MGRGDARKTTVNYTQRSRHKVVNKAKTNDPEKQTKKPTQQGKRFTISTTTFEVCRNTPSKKEEPGIKSNKKKS
jgi:hypothetical protein